MPGTYRWHIGGAGMTAASGTLAGAAALPALAITAFSADPETVSPNDDGQADVTTLTYELTAPATVSLVVHDPIGTPVLDVVTPVRRVAGQHVVAFAPGALPDGAYTVALTARADDGTEIGASIPLLVTRTLGFGAVAPVLFSPNGDGRADELRVRFRLVAAAEVKVRILRDGTWVATPFAGPLAPGPRGVTWDGSKRLGRLLDGSYTAVVEATDATRHLVGDSALRQRHSPARRALPSGQERAGLGERARDPGPADRWSSRPACGRVGRSGRPARCPGDARPRRSVGRCRKRERPPPPLESRRGPAVPYPVRAGRDRADPPAPRAVLARWTR